MSEWQEVLLGEITNKIGSGATPKGGGESYKESGISLIRSQNVLDFKFSSNGLAFIDDSQAYELRNVSVEKDDVLLNITGDSVARCCVVPESVLPARVNQHVAIIRANKDISDNHYIYYSLQALKEELLMQSEIGATRNALTKGMLESLKIPIPALEEQKAIASVLSSLDDKIDLLHRQNYTLERMAETLFRQWFIEEAQENWKEVSFGEFVTPKKGKNITKAEAIEGIYPVIAGGLTPSCFHNKANTNAPVITISASGANAGFVRLYHSPVWSSDSSYIDSTINKYVYFCYAFLKYNQSILTDKQEGSAQPHIYPSHIMDLEALSYPLELIESFESQVKGSFEKIKLNQKQIQTLEKIRDNLLPKLMSGEVRVEMEGVSA